MNPPKYNPTEPCPKCGHDDLAVEYECVLQGMPRVKVERINIRCKRCGNKFARACLDAKEEV